MRLVGIQDLVIVSPLIALFTLSLIPLMIKVFSGNREPNALATLMYNLIGLVLATGLTAALAGARMTAFSEALVIDGLTLWTSNIVYLVTAVGLMLSFDHIATKGRQFSEFTFLMMSSSVGMLMLIMANDLLITFVGIEMTSLCLYILVAMSKEEILSKEAAFKYFVLGSFASAVMLYGIALVFGAVGSTGFGVIADSVPQMISLHNRIFVAGWIMIILGFAFKVSIFPLHSWAPDVYQGAPTPVTAFMATGVKAATFVAFLRLFGSEGLSNLPVLESVISWMAVLTMTVGNTAAILQTNVKRILAYSSVAHSGYALVGLIAAGFGDNFNAAAGSLLFYLFGYSLMTLGAFALVALYESRTNVTVAVSDLKGLASRHPVLALSLSVLLLSLAGLPPTLGFFGKFFVFSAAIEQDMYWLALWAFINSIVSVYYYLRPVVVMYMSEEEDPILAPRLVTGRLMTRAAVMLTALLIVMMGVFSSPLLRAVQRSVSNLF